MDADSIEAGQRIYVLVNLIKKNKSVKSESLYNTVKPPI